MPRRVWPSLLLVFACSEPHAPPQVISAAAPKPAPTASASGSVPPASSAAPQMAELFVYTEPPESISFLPPMTVKLSRPGRDLCERDLPEGGNMFSGSDVRAAYDHAEVKAALAATASWFHPKPGQLRAKAGGSTDWRPDCEGCPEASADVAHLKHTLEVVMMNTRAVCDAPAAP